MGRTVLASAAVALIGGLSAAWLTDGFDVWTAEGARRHSVALKPVLAPQATLVGPALKEQTLHSLLVRPGQATIVSFIYTRCPGVCLALGSSFQQLQATLAAPSTVRELNTAPVDVQLLSISFDPTVDDIDQLQSHATLWRADPNHWRMVAVPDAAQLKQLLAAWQVIVIPDGRSGFEHNAALLVIDHQGRLVRIFDDADVDAALAFARSLRLTAHANTAP
jgi:protein SCO1